jgi:hypothetical protein
LVFPSLVNVSLRNGGFFDENKEESLKNIPRQYLPQSIIVEAEEDFLAIHKKMKVHGLNFPVVAKPLDLQRGKFVEIIKNAIELKDYSLKFSKAFIVQEFIDLPLELAILYSRMPNCESGIVSSITYKEFLSVVGDGKQTIEALLWSNIRAQLIWSDIKKNTKVDLQHVLPKDETLVIEKIGNHCRGTIFKNAMSYDKQKVAKVMEDILKDFDGFYYGRFDLKVKGEQDLYEGKNIKILELNGVNADAAHIFDPNYGLIQAYKDVAWHWKRMSNIARYNYNVGHRPSGFFHLIRKIF